MPNSARSDEIQRLKAPLHPNEEVYLTQHQGTFYYRVGIDRSASKVEVRKLEVKDDWKYEIAAKPEVAISFTEIFVGDNHSEYKGKRWWPKGSSYEGNSMLIRWGNRTYIFVNEAVSAFKIPSSQPDDVIHTFLSPVMWNGVPYPVAISNSLVYFLIERRTLPSRVVGETWKTRDLYATLYSRKKELHPLLRPFDEYNLQTDGLSQQFVRIVFYLIIAFYVTAIVFSAVYAVHLKLSRRTEHSPDPPPIKMKTLTPKRQPRVPGARWLS